MLYGTAGVAWGHITSPPLASLDGWRTGWTVGAGIEHALPRNWSAKVEYRYTDLGRASSSTPSSIRLTTIPSPSTPYGLP